MKVACAREAARRWADEVASGLPGFQGAFFHGSINEMSEDEDFPPTSDVDVGVVFPDADTLPKLGKVSFDGVIVEGAPISFDRLANARQLLGDYRLGQSFRTDRVISDPTGHLRRVQPEVEGHFAEPRWVLRRCEDARDNCLRYVSWLDASAPYYVQATCWLFAEGNLAHVLLAAGMRNPTVRRRYSAVRELLASVGRLDVHESLLKMLGCAAMARPRVLHHLERMTEVFDRASSVIRSEFPFGSDLSELARPVAIDGSRELIQRGEHREAMFWIAVTYARCMAVLNLDAPGPVAEAFQPGFVEVLRDLGVEGFADMQVRAAEIEAFLPELMSLAATRQLQPA